MNLTDTTNATSLPGSADGRSPYAGPDLNKPMEYGPAPVPVSRFRARACTRGIPINDTSGQPSTISLLSANLQRCLESRLQAKMAENGSLEFALTWKTWVMPAGQPICALRASVRRTVDNGCSGLANWKTPTVQDAHNNGSPSQMKRNSMPLNAQASLAGWPTPQAIEQKETSEAKLMRGAHAGLNLAVAAQMACWNTPTVRDAKSSGGGGKNPRDLTRQAALAGWQTPKLPSGGPCKRNTPGGGLRKLEDQADGAISTSYHAETGKRGVLRPGHSRWLMGFPDAWDFCGATAMQSCRKLPRSL